MQSHSSSANENDAIVSAEACEILRIDRATLTRWVATGKVTPARKLPGRTGPFLFRRGDIESLASATASEASA